MSEYIDDEYFDPERLSALADYYGASADSLYSGKLVDSLNKRISELEAEVSEIRSENARLNRTIEFSAEEYLAEHGHWGMCKWRIEVSRLQGLLREIVEETEKGCMGNIDKCARIVRKGLTKEGDV